MGIPFGVRLLGIEANLSLLRHLSGRYSHLKGYWAANPSCSPEDVGPSPALGTRPHLVEWLWEHIQRRIPSSRPWVVLGTPVLVNPDSEIVFAFAAGSDYALRLPAQTREAAIAAGAKRSAGTGGATVNLSVIGEEWVFGMGQSDAEEWWHRALEYSASTT
jgi:hypothetical protein